ncbi:hypothetical protein FE257_009739 [Aspergillus nanangensis]|uniref:Uncharacterized protein n=1 Tax=Aspergillus nanangensis TaxID=2582783 RepID=A0AAD4CJE8_ASPNN|nr:hypothetical protein FE257_009739 [Aspergillus nanangensis]
MLFSKLAQSVALATVFAAGALADAASINAELQNLQKGTADFRDAINNYDGGFKTMVPIATHTLRMSMAANSVRKAADASEPIPESEARAVREESDKTIHGVNEALDAAERKASTPDPNGFKDLWGFGVQYFGKRYANAADSIKAKLPEDSTSRVLVTHDNTIERFQAVQASFQ